MHRIQATAVFKTLSVLHLGSGLVEATEGESRTVARIATAVSDAGLRPWIPGSSLKGALRNLADGADQEALFGVSHAKDALHVKGCVTVLGATAREASVFQLTQTSVDRGTGVSEANKLFTKEYVEVGTAFDAEFWLEIRQGDPEDLLNRFLGVLAQFASPVGIEVGSGKSDSLGRLAIEGPVKITRQVLTASGFKTTSETKSELMPPAAHAPEVTFDLKCPGPYIAMGAPPATEGHGDDKRDITIPLRDPMGNPRQTGTGISGALRTRAEWLLAVQGTNLDGTETECKTSAGTTKLNLIQRLFGHTGYRSALKLRVHEITKSGLSRHPSVAIDPISQAPSSGALYTVEADHGVSLTFSLTVWRKLRPDEDTLFKKLCDDVQDNGLQLGAGGTKGFGWFHDKTDAITQGEIKQHRPDASSADELTPRQPDDAVTLPYRMMAVDTDKIGMPTPAVLNAWQKMALHNTPLTGGLSGWLDVSWCFETPMLIGNGKAINAPQKIGDRPYLPGTTIRGALRAIIAAATSSRLTHVNDVDIPAPPAKAGPLRANIAELKASPEHAPPHDDTFEPDFTEALFGFIRDTPEGQKGASHHRKLHLKSRLSFGFANLLSQDDIRQRPKVFELVMGAPNTASKLYDQIGRKTYPADSATSERVRDRLESHRPGNRDLDSATKLAFLHPRANAYLEFRGRIKFHNVAPEELGALMWAVTWGGDPRRRHRIGHAKAFGAGRCFASGLHLHIEPHDGNTPAPAMEAETNLFGLQGHSFWPFVQTFKGYLAQNGLSDLQGFEDLVTAARPEIGQRLRGTNVSYQTWRELRDKAPAIRDAQGGRLAAMLKPAEPAE